MGEYDKKPAKTAAGATAGPAADDRYDAGAVADNVQSRIIKYDVVGERTRITIARGKNHGIHAGMEGYIKSAGGMLADFQIDEAREALEAALQAFPGTVLLVSHDRALLDAVAGRLLAVESKTIASYPGGWADYVSAQEEGPVAPPPPPVKPKAEKPKRAPKPKESQIQLVEAAVAKAESRLAELEQKLAADWGDAELVAEHRAAREDLEELLSRWEALFESTTP